MRTAARSPLRIVAALCAVLLAVAGCGTESPEPSAPPKPVVYFLGDSYTVGVNGMPESGTYASDLARARGWRVKIAGYPLAGFVRRDKYHRDYAAIYRRELAALPAPDLLIIAGAHNDRKKRSARIRAKVSALLVGVHRHWPRTSIVLVGPMWGGAPTTAALRVRDAVRAAAQARGVPFIDPLAERWFTGHQDEGTGNAARFVLPDQTHPNRKGHRHMAKRLSADLNRLGLPRSPPSTG